MDLKDFLSISKNKKEPFKWDMDLMKRGFLFRHHYTTKIKIKSPYNPKSKSRMEGETF